MYHQIIVPLDRSGLAEQALPLGAALARWSGATLRLVHVHSTVLPLLEFGRWTPAHTPRPAVEDALVQSRATCYLRRVARLMRQKYHVASVCEDVNEGEPAAALLAHARRADLIVMATHGHGGLGRAMLGSVSDRVVRKANAPVILVRARSEPTRDAGPVSVTRILVPFDGSAAAAAVFGPVRDLARVARSSITLLLVASATREACQAHRGAPSIPRDEGGRLLSDVADQLRDVPNLSTLLMTETSPARAILSVATEIQADLIALTTTGRGGVFRRLLLGSVTDQVVRAAVVPVLVCRPPSVRRSRTNVSGQVHAHGKIERRQERPVTRPPAATREPR